MTNLSEVLVHVYRGERLESLHRGHVAVVDTTGRVLAYAGDPYATTFFRSAAKPMQALNVVFSGAADRFGFTQEELAVMCGSHYGESFHVEAVRSILEKASVPVTALRCPASLSMNGVVALRQAREGVEPNPLFSNCSGKHGGMLAACAAKAYDVATYDRPEHPVQREVLHILSELCGVAASRIGIGEDGCGVPVHYMPLYNMALGYAQFANPSGLSQEYRVACARMFGAMQAAPEMVSGTAGFCTELMRYTGGRLMAKLGAEAVYCVGVKDRNIGIAVKIEDGTGSRATAPAVIEVLRQLDVLRDDEVDNLHRFVRPENRNEHGHVVGGIEPVFRLHRVNVA